MGAPALGLRVGAGVPVGAASVGAGVLTGLSVGAGVLTGLTAFCAKTALGRLTDMITGAAQTA